MSASAKRLVTTEATRVFVSAASLWEIAIKHALGRGDMPVDAARAADAFTAAGFEELAVTWNHTRRLQQLDGLHKDPFDRLLVAQALEEPLVLVTHDAAVAAYSRSFVRV